MTDKTLERKNLQFYSTQDIGDQEINAVLKVLKSDHLSNGPKIKQFEHEIADACKAKYVLALNSATSALHLAYIMANVSEESRVWTTPLTFVATANTALQLGAEIDFVDINADTLNICPQLLEDKLRVARSSNKLPDILTVVHFAGSPCDMDSIHSLSQKYGFKVIEDASHALGATYNKVPIGGDNRSTACIFSFHPVKMITTGEGGALILECEEMFERAKRVRSHGIDYLGNSHKIKKIRPWYYEQNELGYNYRITEMQAALGIVQISRLSSFLRKRNELSKLYKEKLKNLPLKFQSVEENSLSSYHLFTVKITDKNYDRDELFRFLKSHQIASQVHYIPVYRQPFYRSLGFCKNYCKNAEEYFSSCLSIPLHQKLNESDIDFVAKKLNTFFS